MIIPGTRRLDISSVLKVVPCNSVFTSSVWAKRTICSSVIKFFPISGQPVTVIPPPVVLTPTVVGQPMTTQGNNPQDAFRRAQEQAQVRKICVLEVRP